MSTEKARTMSDNTNEPASDQKPEIEVEKIVAAAKPGSTIAIFSKNEITTRRLGVSFEESGDKPKASKEQEDFDIFSYIYDFKPASRISGICPDLSNEINTIIRDRIVIIDSYDHKILLSAITKFLEDECFSGLSKKRMNFDRGDKNGVGLLFQTLIYDVFKTSKDTILTLFTNASVACEHFMNQIFTNDFKTAIGEYQRILSETNSYIVFVISEPKFISILNEKESEIFLSRKHLAFLEFLLAEIYEKKDIEDLTRIISEQRRKGEWSKNDEVFYMEISRGLSKLGAEEFKRIVSDNTKEKNELLYKSIIEKDREEINKFFEKKDDLLKCISYIAVNFEGISVNEFNYLMQAILADPEKKEVVDNPLKKEEKIEKKLLERWNHDADILLKEIHIKEIGNNQADGKIIDFDKSGFRDVFKAEFYSDHTWFSHQQFSYLYFNEGLLFRSDIPYRIQENFIRIAAEISTNEPDLYCQKLLIYTSFYIINQKAKIDFKINPYEDDIEIAFEKYLRELDAKKMEVEWRKQEALRKIGLLIAEMYKYENLRDRINAFFNLFIDYSFHDVVFFFVKYLRKVPGFDTLYWIKQLLNRGPDPLKQDTYDLLTRYLLEDTPIQAYDALKKIKEWYSSKERLDSFSDSGGLCVLLDYMFASIRRIEYKDYGKYPTDFHLFSVFDKPGDEIEIIEFVTEWLLHPKLAEASDTIDRLFNADDSSDFYVETLANLIVMITTILNGIQVGKNVDNGRSSVRISQMILAEIKAKAGKTQIKSLKEGFRNWRDFYDARKKNENSGSKEFRQIFFSLSKTSAGLLNYFNKQ